MPARSTQLIDATLEASSLAHEADATLAEQFAYLFAEEMQRGERTLVEFIPNPGPQTRALETEAEEVLYGGSAGSGKSFLLVGLACTKHHRSIIFRSEFEELKAIIDEIENLLEVPRLGTYNSTRKRFKLNDGRIVELGGLKDPGSEKKFQGRPHDFLGFDELATMREDQYLFLHTWVRSTKIGQRVRIFSTTNPPTSAEGLWVIKRWGAWLDPKHHNPAKDGEIRWYYTDEKGEDREAEGPETIENPANPKKPFTPMSRTFIRARIGDNPYYAGTRYEAILNNLKEPLRSQMRDGIFGVSFDDAAMQVVPTLWIEMAMDRWTRDGHKGLPMQKLGVDVARGGRAKTVMAPKHGQWIGELLKYKGVDTPDGKTVAGLVIQNRGRSTTVNIDASGVGADAYERCKDILGAAEEGGRVCGIWFQDKSEKTDSSGLISFLNKRSEGWWLLREALDPEGPNPLALPPDQELKADLAAPHWKPSPQGIKIESKEDLEKRLGRSTDAGDSVVYACMDDSADPVASVESQKVEIAPATTAPEIMKAENGSVLVIRDPNMRRRPWN